MKRKCILIWCLFITAASLGQQTKPFTLSGRIVDFNAKPVVGAEGVVYEEVFHDDKNVAKVMTSIIKTDRQGCFVINDNINTRAYTYIVARKPGLAMAWDKVNRYGITKGKGRIILMLDKPGKLSGIVVDHNGSPVSDATVQAVPKTTYLSRLDQAPIVGPKEWFQTKTDSKGIFSFNSFSHDVSSDFWVKAPTLNCTYKFTTHPQSCCGFEVGRPDIKLALPRETRVQGRVVEAETGKPIESVKLAIQAQRQRNIVQNLYITRIVTSGKDGRFVCEGLPEGKSIIELATEEQQKSQWALKLLTIDIRPDSTNDDIQVTVEKGGFIELLVQEEETNRPLCDFFARVWGENALYILGLNPSGKARFCVLPGEYKVNFWHKEPYSSWFANDPAIVKTGKTSHLPITMEKVPNISGKIIDPDDEPAAGIIVTVSPYGDQVYTDKNGVFKAMGSKKDCNIIAQDFKKGLVAVHHVKDISDPPSIRLKSGLTVTGEIIDSNGIGITAARVCFHGHKVSPEVLTDPKGRFEIKAVPPIQPSFDYRLSVYASGFAPKTYKRISLENEHENTFKVKTIQLEPANMSMSGIVVDANGVPAPGVILFVHGVDGADQPDKSTATDENGRFAFKRICKGLVRIQVNFSNSPGGSGHLTAEAGTQDLRAVLGQDIVHLNYKSLNEKPLPKLKDLGIELSPEDLNAKMILVCFFDMEQRPSRYYLNQLAKQANQLKQKGLTIIAVQTSKMEQKTLNQWVKKYNIPFTIGMIQADVEKTKFSWGVRSLPWLILTDKQNKVCAEGFNLTELDERLSKKKEP